MRIVHAGRKMATGVYIDGLNFTMALKGTQYKWLDENSLSITRRDQRYQILHRNDQQTP